jgi:hypothetical protein
VHALHEEFCNVVRHLCVRACVCGCCASIVVCFVCLLYTCCVFFVCL